MRLEELRDKRIRWDLTPENAFAQGFAISRPEDLEQIKRYYQELDGSYFFYINVWNCKASLAVMEMHADGTGKGYPVEQDIISEEELEEAVWDAGGAINMSGHYPLTPNLIRKLKEFLVGFQSCYYRNEVDMTVARKGTGMRSG